MPSLELLQGIISLGSTGLLLIGIWWLATGRGRVGSEVDKREAKLEKAIEDWKKLAQEVTPELKRQNDLLEQAIDLLSSSRTHR